MVSMTVVEYNKGLNDFEYMNATDKQHRRAQLAEVGTIFRLRDLLG